MADIDAPSSSISGLTELEAREFHKIFVSSFIIFVLVAIVAHVLAWQWRPWLPGPEGYALITDGLQGVAAQIKSYIA